MVVTIEITKILLYDLIFSSQNILQAGYTMDNTLNIAGWSTLIFAKK